MGWRRASVIGSVPGLGAWSWPHGLAVVYGGGPFLRSAFAMRMAADELFAGKDVCIVSDVSPAVLYGWMVSAYPCIGLSCAGVLTIRKSDHPMMGDVADYTPPRPPLFIFDSPKKIFGVSPHIATDFLQRLGVSCLYTSDECEALDAHRFKVFEAVFTAYGLTVKIQKHKSRPLNQGDQRDTGSWATPPPGMDTA